MPPARQEGDDLAEVVEGAEVLGIDGRGGRQALLIGSHVPRSRLNVKSPGQWQLG